MPAPSPLPQRILLNLALILAGGGLGVTFVADPAQVALIWPPSGVAYALLLLYGRHWWPLIAAGILLLHLSIDPVPASFVPFSMAANVVGALAGTTLLRWLQAEPLERLSVRLGLNLLMGAALMSVVSALIGVSGMITAGMAPPSAWLANGLTWTLSGLFGTVTITPAYLLLARRLAARTAKRRQYALRAEKLLWALALGLSMLMLLLSSSSSPAYALGLATVPMALLLWSALRFEPLLTALATAVLALFVAVVAGLGVAGFTAPSDARDAALLLLFLCFAAVVPQMLAAATHMNRVSAEDLLERARTDALTGLPNRSAFEESVRAGGRPGEALALAYLDLDQFKLVNDTLSHSAGDELIRELAGLIGAMLDERAVLARIGGDEFGLLLRGQSPGQALATLERLREAVAALRMPWQDRIMALTVSIGVVCYRHGERGYAELLAAVDSACFAAKELGGNRIELAHSDAPLLAERHAAMHWAMRITEALDQDGLVLFGQPILHLSDPDAPPRHIEVLVRMRECNGEALLPPAQFVHAAERFGLAARLDRRVVCLALRQLAEHPLAAAHIDCVSINLSAATLMDQGFVDFLSRQLAETALPAAKLCFEITETSAVRDLRRAQQFIGEVRALGCHFALDDFGTGFCSFAYLQQLEVDAFKIDGSFVREVADSPVALAIVRSIIEIARVLGRRTIAECVETAAQRERVRELGVDYVQGFQVAAPEPLSALLQRLQSATRPA